MVLKHEISVHALRCLIEIFYRGIVRIVFSSKGQV